MVTRILTEADAPEQSSTLDGVKKNAEKPLPSYPIYKFLKWEFVTPIVWMNVFYLSFWHIVGIYGFTRFHYLKLWSVLYIITVAIIAGFGVTAGVHRYFTHRSYKANLPLRIILMLCFATAGQSSVIEWVRDHRVHHKFSETDADPHNAKRGFFFAHMGWLMVRKHPEVVRQGRKIDIKDMLEDPVVVFQKKHFQLMRILCCYAIPTAILPLFFGESWYDSILTICFSRYIVSLNSILSINSFAHIWGTKPYDRMIHPTENLGVSFFAMGEGYHNYHHTFPWDYRASELGKSLNLSTFLINMFAKIGWAYDLRSPSEELIKKVIQNHGDGSHYRWGHEVPVSESDARKLEEKKL